MNITRNIFTLQIHEYKCHHIIFMNEMIVSIVNSRWVLFSCKFKRIEQVLLIPVIFIEQPVILVWNDNCLQSINYSIVSLHIVFNKSKFTVDRSNESREWSRKWISADRRNSFETSDIGWYEILLETIIKELVRFYYSSNSKVMIIRKTHIYNN